MYTVKILFDDSLDLYGGNCLSFFYLGLSFYFMPKIGKHLKKIVNINFESTYIEN